LFFLSNKKNNVLPIKEEKFVKQINNKEKSPLLEKEPASQLATTKISGKLPQILVAKATYNCDGGRTIYAWFYKGEEIKTTPGQMPLLSGIIKINLSDARSMELVQTISADGGRYANSGESFVFWDKGGQALILENGVEKNYTNCRIDNLNSSNTVKPENSSNTDAGITIGNEYRGYFEKEKYYYPIGGGVEIIFAFRNPDSENRAERQRGDIILKKDGQNYILLENTSLGALNGNYTVKMTNDPNILVLHNSGGDLGVWFTNDYYLEMKKNKIILRVDNGSSNILTVQKGDLPAMNLGLSIIGECGEIGQRTGKKARITDLTINDKPANALGKPIEFGCDDEAMFGPGYDIRIDFQQTRIGGDFSKFYFVIKGSKRDDENEIEKELWKKEFYISLDNQTSAKIYKEN
jgi:membrane-bound inhibitor of C-type lysozyme